MLPNRRRRGAAGILYTHLHKKALFRLFLLPSVSFLLYLQLARDTQESFSVGIMKKGANSFGEIFRHSQAVYVLLGLAWLSMSTMATGVAHGAQANKETATAQVQEAERGIPTKQLKALQHKNEKKMKAIDRMQKQIARYQEQIDYLEMRLELHEDCRSCGTGHCDHDDVKCRHWAVGMYKGKRVRVCHQLPHGPKRYSGIDQAISRHEKQIEGLERNKEMVSDKIAQLEEEIEQNEASIHALEEQMNPTTGEDDALPETLEEVVDKIEELEEKSRSLNREVREIEEMIRSHEACRDCETCRCNNRSSSLQNKKRSCKHESYDGMVKHRLPVGNRRYHSIDKAVARLTKKRQAIEDELKKIPNEIAALKEIKRNGLRVRAHKETYQKTKDAADTPNRPKNIRQVPNEEEEDFGYVLPNEGQTSFYHF